MDYRGLTEEQQLVWSALLGAPYHAHHMARDMLAVKGRGKQFHQRVDQHLGTVLRLYKGDEVIRIVFTWLNIYKVPMDPIQLENFNLFQELYGQRVINMRESDIKIAGY